MEVFANQREEEVAIKEKEGNLQVIRRQEIGRRAGQKVRGGSKKTIVQVKGGRIPQDLIKGKHISNSRLIWEKKARKYSEPLNRKRQP